MQILFVHQNFPAQFLHLATRLVASGHGVAAIGGPTSRPIPNVAMKLARYERTARGSTQGIHPLALRFEADCLRAEAAALAATRLAGEGFSPDVIVGHDGWGELFLLTEIWPKARVLAYAEYYNQRHGADFSFDTEFKPPDPGRNHVMRTRNAGLALALSDADLVVAPTQFQRALHPPGLRDRIAVVHDGIDTGSARPRDDATLQIPGGPLLRAGDEVVTYVNRRLEPLRGMHSFLRALPDVLAARPAAQVVIVGSTDGTAYGGQPSEGGTWKDKLLAELGDRLDARRVHWLGHIGKSTLLDAFAVSRAHVYLTYPFVLSWSLLEAMSAGCLVIGSNTAPVAEVIVHQKNGLLVDFHDHAALSKQLVEALSQPADAFRAIRQNARQTILDRYDRDTVCLPKLIAMIEGLGPQKP
jgi:glycosyltransferase involved in cell wall biosynthesis